MKSKLYKIAILLLLAALIGVVAFFGFPHYLKHTEDSTLQAVARHARQISTVEVLRLSATGETGPAGSYRVRYDDSRRGITARHVLAGPRAAELVRLWGRVRFAEGYLSGCHEPGFVLRFLEGEHSIFEVAVCFECENVSWQASPFVTSLRQMYPTDLDKKSGTADFKAFLMQLE